MPVRLSSGIISKSLITTTTPKCHQKRHYYSSNASTVSSEENSIFPSTATGNDHSFAASFSDLTPGVSYAVIVSRSEIDLLAPENLIYINQFRATSSGYQQSSRLRAALL